MFVIEVIPFAKNAPQGTLSYRHRERLMPGALLSVPLRAKRVPGVVVSITPVQDAKASIKQAGFMLRAGTLTKTGSIPSAIMAAVSSVARYHACSLGSVLNALLGEYLESGAPSFPKGAGFTETLLEARDTERTAAYVRLISTQVNRKKSTLLIVPTLVEGLRWHERLSEFAPTLLTGAHTPKERATVLESVQGAQVVIATPAYSWFPLKSLGALIIERAGAGTYVREQRPYLDLRVAARMYAEAREITCILGDLPLPFSLRSPVSASPQVRFGESVQIVDTRPEETEEKVIFKAVPEEVISKIKEHLDAGSRVAVLAARKGYAPAVVCRDCGNLVQDELGRTLTFAKTGAKPLFRTSDGSLKRDADIHCKHCGSWNLLPLGIGVERVVEELILAFPDAPLIQIEPEKLRSNRAISNVREKIATSSLIVGSESLLPFIDPSHPVALGVIASADTLLSLPFWTARERLVRLGLAFRDRAQSLTIATRHPEDAAFSAIREPSAKEFWKEEADLRKQFMYPPFARLLVLKEDVSAAKTEAAYARMEAVSESLTRVAPRRISTTQVRVTGVAKYPAEGWPDAKISTAITTLPPSVSVYIDPDSLW